MKLLKRVALGITVLIMCISYAGCGNKNKTVSSESEIDSEISLIESSTEETSDAEGEVQENTGSNSEISQLYNDEVDVIEDNLSEQAVTGSIEIGQWGKTNKYNGPDGKYEEVYLKIRCIDVGQQAEDKVEALMMRNDYPFVEAPKNMSYIYIEYEINFGDVFNVNEYDGASPSVLVHAYNKDKEQIEVDKIKYSISGIDLTTSENIRKQGVGRVALLMPDGYGETNVFLGDDLSNAISVNIKEE